MVRVLYPGIMLQFEQILSSFVKESTYFAIDPIVNVEIMRLLNAKPSVLLSGLFAWEFPRNYDKHQECVVALTDKRLMCPMWR